MTRLPSLNQTMNELAASTQSMSMEELRQQLTQQTQKTAESIARMAVIWRALERRGEDMTKWRAGLAAYLPAVAANRLAPEAVVRLAGNATALRAVALLPVDDQNDLLQRGTVDVMRDGETESVPLIRLRPADVRQAFDGITGRVVPVEEQKRSERRRRVINPLNTRVVVPLTREEHTRLQEAAARSKRSAAELIRSILQQDRTI